MTPKKLLPRKVNAWCLNCNSFVPIKLRTATVESGTWEKIRSDGYNIDIDTLHKPVTKNIAFCKRCDHEVDCNILPSQAIDCLRVIAEMIHAGYDG